VLLVISGGVCYISAVCVIWYCCVLVFLCFTVLMCWCGGVVVLMVVGLLCVLL